MTSIIEPGYSHNRTILHKVVPLRSPFVVQLTPSSFCPFKCNYCIQSSPLIRKRELMSWNTFTKVCDQILEFDDQLKQISIAGWGEPLTNNRLPDMIKHMKDLDIAKNIMLITNGHLLTEKKSLELVNAGLDNIRISLEGMNSDKYKKIAGVTLNFNDLINKIKFFYDNRKNCKVYVKVADISLDNGEKELFYKTFINITDSMYVENIRPIFENNDGKYMNKWGMENPIIEVCTPPFFQLQVNENGDTIPCCGYYDALDLGNVHTTTLKEMWESKKLKDFQLMLLSKNRRNQNIYPACKDCTIPNIVILPEDELDSYADAVLNRYNIRNVDLSKCVSDDNGICRSG